MLQVTVEGPVARVLVGTGARGNALPSDGWRRIAATFDELSTRDDLRAVIVSGNGDSFCAGSDMTEWREAPLEFVNESFRAMESAFRAIEQCPIPVVAEIRGAAAGAGCQLALACDLRVMALSARIGMPVARLGIRVSPAFAARISRVAGTAIASELLVGGRLFDASRAMATGLVNEVRPDDEVAATTAQLIDNIVALPPSAARAAKQAILAARPVPPEHTGPAVDYEVFRTAVTRFLDRSAHPHRS